MLSTLSISNYRSLLKLTIPLGPLNLITGPNGSGKSNLYRALRLLAETAQGGVVNALAGEGRLRTLVARSSAGGHGLDRRQVLLQDLLFETPMRT
jgi:predicted ATPase